MNLPNKLTVLRLILAFIFVGLMSFHQVWLYIIAYIVFIVASVTDYYDGKIARERNLITNFGKLLDPVADKVLLVSAFIMMMQIPTLQIPAWTVVVILTREFLVTGARSIAASDGVVIAANKWGKTKVVIQMIYIYTFLFFAIALELVIRAMDNKLPFWFTAVTNTIMTTSMICMALVALVTAWSGVEFARSHWKVLNIGAQS